MSIKLSFACKLYYTTATRATWGGAVNGAHVGTGPALTLWDAIKNVTLNLPDGEADVSMRSGNGSKSTLQALTDGSVEIEFPWDDSDVNMQAFLHAKLQRKTIAVAALTDLVAVAGAQGPWADWTVVNIGRDENIESAAVGKITIKYGPPSPVAPEWAVCSGS